MIEEQKNKEDELDGPKNQKSAQILNERREADIENKAKYEEKNKKYK